METYFHLLSSTLTINVVHRLKLKNASVQLESRIMRKHGKIHQPSASWGAQSSPQNKRIPKNTLINIRTSYVKECQLQIIKVTLAREETCRHLNLKRMMQKPVACVNQLYEDLDASFLLILTKIERLQCYSVCRSRTARKGRIPHDMATWTLGALLILNLWSRY